MKSSKYSSRTFMIGILLSVCIFSQPACSSSSTTSTHDPKGLRFTCDKLYPLEICFDLLRPGCALHGEEENSLPPEASQRVVLQVDDERRVVRSPRDLDQCVTIQGPADALEYARFFSSYRTTHLFDQQRIEIFPGRTKACGLACLPPKLWGSLGLPEATVRETDEGFRVIRSILRRVDQKPGIGIFVEEELITPTGGIRLISSERVQASRDHLLHIGFPMYL